MTRTPHENLKQAQWQLDVAEGKNPDFPGLPDANREIAVDSLMRAYHRAESALENPGPLSLAKRRDARRISDLAADRLLGLCTGAETPLADAYDRKNPRRKKKNPDSRAILRRAMRGT